MCGISVNHCQLRLAYTYPYRNHLVEIISIVILSPYSVAYTFPSTRTANSVDQIFVGPDIQWRVLTICLLIKIGKHSGGFKLTDSLIMFISPSIFGMYLLLQGVTLWACAQCCVHFMLTLSKQCNGSWLAGWHIMIVIPYFFFLAWGKINMRIEMGTQLSLVVLFSHSALLLGWGVWSLKIELSILNSIGFCHFVLRAHFIL